MTVIVAGLLAAAAAVWTVGRVLRRRRRTGSAEQALALRLIPVEQEVQQEIRETAQAGTTAAATSRIQEVAGVSLSRAHTLTRQLAAGDTLLTSWPEAVEVLRQQRPELVAELARLRRQQGTPAAIRALQRHIPVELAGGHHLIHALPETDTTE
ncbi:hypothetical protein [Salinifilum aidingensis]